MVDEKPTSDAPDAPAFGAEDRPHYVVHQQELAVAALHGGVPGAARAALRVLWPSDFVDRDAACRAIRLLRHGDDEDPALTDALHLLVRLEPRPRRLRPSTVETGAAPSAVACPAETPMELSADPEPQLEPC